MSTAPFVYFPRFSSSLAFLLSSPPVPVQACCVSCPYLLHPTPLFSFLLFSFLFFFSFFLKFCFLCFPSFGFPESLGDGGAGGPRAAQTGWLGPDSGIHSPSAPSPQLLPGAAQGLGLDLAKACCVCRCCRATGNVHCWEAEATGGAGGGRGEGKGKCRYILKTLNRGTRAASVAPASCRRRGWWE